MSETVTQPRPLARIVRGSGPGLVLAHGGGGGAELNWGTFVLPLAERHTVIAPDFPGSGRTPAEPGPLELDDLADRLVATAVEEGQTAFDLVGFSLGAAVAVRAARRHPGLVRSLTLVAGLAHTTPHLRLLTDCLLTAQHHDPLLQARLALSLLLSPEWINTQADDDLLALAKLMLVTAPPGFRRQFELAAEVDVRPDLPHLTVPTLVISPTADALVSPAQHRLLAATIPGAELLELPSGHLVLTERRAELLTALRAFLARQN